jgi:hypothetical protein
MMRFVTKITALVVSHTITRVASREGAGEALPFFNIKAKVGAVFLNGCGLVFYSAPSFLRP